MPRNKIPKKSQIPGIKNPEKTQIPGIKIPRLKKTRIPGFSGFSDLAQNKKIPIPNPTVIISGNTIKFLKRMAEKFREILEKIDSPLVGVFQRSINEISLDSRTRSRNGRPIF